MAKTILTLIFLGFIAGCAERPGESFQITKSTTTIALQLKTGNLVQLNLPKGCVITVEAQKMKSDLQCNR